MKNDGNQKYLLLGSVVLSAIIGLGALPIITRGFDVFELALVSLILLFNGMFGVFDFFRPVYISTFSLLDRKIGIWDIVLSSFVVIMFTWPIFIPIYIYVFSDYISIASYTAVFGAYVCFVGSTGFWAVLDVNGKVGLTALLRSVGTSFVYLTFVGFIAIQNTATESFSIALLGSQFFILFVSAIYAFPCLDLGWKIKLEKKFFKQGLLTLLQNNSKMIIDFADRLFVSKMFPASLVGVYNIFYDVSSKSNMPSQLSSTYYYPKICRNKDALPSFLLKGLIISFSILLCSLLFLFFGKELLNFYFGNKVLEYSGLFASMLVIWSVFSLAFFSQSALRSMGEYGWLLGSFSIAAVAGIILLYPLYILFGLSGVFISVVVMKSPGLYGYWKLKNIIGRYNILFLFLLIMQVTIFVISLRNIGM
ncbi:hypothetical protein H0A65_16480 [Alcaligenaceae bacterium]|nr:hypothetical protein [Alcaligenaceae bacterium]